MYNKDFDYPEYGSSLLFFLPPLSPSMHVLEQYPAIIRNNHHHHLQNSCLHNIQNHTSLSTVTCAMSRYLIHLLEDDYNPRKSSLCFFAYTTTLL